MLNKHILQKMITACITGAVLAVLATYASAQEYTLRMGHSGQTTEPLHVLGTKWAELLAERTKGKVMMNVHPQGQLGDEKSLAEQLRLGTVDATMVAADVLVGFVPQITVIGLPFAFQNYDQAHRFLDGAGGKVLLDKLEGIGLKGVGFVDTGYRSIGNKVRPIRTPEDLKGLKIREIPSPLVLDTIRALGGNAVPIPWAETVPALQQGIVDGVGTTPSFFWSARLYEYTKYFSYTQHLYTANVVLFSRKTFDKLPSDIQRAVLETGKEAIAHTRKYVTGIESKLTENLESKGVKVNKPDLGPFRAKAQVVWGQYEEKIGPELMGHLRDAIK